MYSQALIKLILADLKEKKNILRSFLRRRKKNIGLLYSSIQYHFLFFRLAASINIKVFFFEVFLFGGSNSVTQSGQQLPCMWELGFFNSSLILEADDLGYERHAKGDARSASGLPFL